MKHIVTPVYGNGWTDFCSEGVMDVPEPFEVNELTDNGPWKTGTIHSPGHIFHSHLGNLIVRFHDEASKYTIYDVTISTKLGDPDILDEATLFAGSALVKSI